MALSQKRGMIGVIKEFDRVDHDRNDNRGKQAVLRFLNSTQAEHGVRTIENPNEYGIDLLTLNDKNEVVGCWEVEVRSGNWRGDVLFPFSTINCIERKDYQWRKDEEFQQKIPSKFRVTPECEVFYVQLNDECTRATIINGKTILQYPLVPWKNRKAEGEYVRQVPIKETLQVKL